MYECVERFQHGSGVGGSTCPFVPLPGRDHLYRDVLMLPELCLAVLMIWSP